MHIQSNTLEPYESLLTAQPSFTHTILLPQTSDIDWDYVNGHHIFVSDLRQK